MNNLYLTATEAHSGKSAIALGMMQLLLGKVGKVGFFRPIISQIDKTRFDHDIELIIKHFKLNFVYDECFACTLSEARTLLNAGQSDVLMEKILRKYKKLQDKCDFILCEGTDFFGKDITFEFDLNTDIAANLTAPLIFVTNAGGRSVQELASTFQANTEIASNKGVDIASCIFNMATLNESETAELYELTKHKLKEHSEDLKTQVYIIPHDTTLNKPSMEDVKSWLGAHVLYGHGRMDTLVSDYLVAAMQVNNFINYIEEGHLVITPGDRADIVLAGLTSRLSTSYPDIAGILLTGGLELPKSVHKLIEGWTGVPVPILSVEHHTYKTVEILTDLHGRIEAGDDRKVNRALAIFEKNIDIDEFAKNVIGQTSEKITPTMFEFKIMDQARRKRMRIVLPEGTEDRILQAVEILEQRRVAEIILLGDTAKVKAKISALGLTLDNVTIIQPSESEHLEDFATTYYELRKAKGITLEQARDRMQDATYFGTMMVYKNMADGMVSGSINTTAHTIRPALEFIKTKPGFSIVSSIFFMCLKDRVLAFGDCAINPDPNAAQLAEIAINAAETAATFGINPRVAMLSYSTGTSGKGVDVEKVIEATRIVRELDPNMLVEGPIQYDAAIDPDVAKTKLPDSKVAGHATVFVFPDLNTGNNTYKAVQRAADAIAIGPVLQGLNKPVNDLSRGCTVADIVNTVAITAVQAQSIK